MVQKCRLFPPLAWLHGASKHQTHKKNNVMIPLSTKALASQARRGQFAPLALACFLLCGAVAHAQTTNWLFFPFTDAPGSNTTVSSTSLGGIAGVTMTGYTGSGALVDLHGAAGSGVNGAYNGDGALCLTNGDVGTLYQPNNSPNPAAGQAANNLCDLGDPLLANTITNFVVSLWFNQPVKAPSGGGFQLPRLFVLSSSTNGSANDGSANSIGVKFQQENQFIFSLNTTALTTTFGAGSPPTNYPPGDFAINTWYFVAWAYDGTNIYQYTGSASQPATLVNQVAAPGLSVALGANPSLVIGNRNFKGARGFDGWIQDFRIDTGVPTNAAAFLEGIRQSSPGIILNVNFIDDSINVAYGGNNKPAPSAMSGAAVIGSPGDVWNGLGGFAYSPYPNNATYTTIAGALAFSDGTRSAVTLSLSAPSGTYDANSSGFNNYSPFSWTSLANENANTGYPNTPYATLMASCLVANSTNATGFVTLSNLSPNGIYNLYTYNASDEAETAGRTSTFTVNGVTQTSTYDGATTTLVNGVDYLEFAGVAADANGVLTIDFGDSIAKESDFNGFQLQFVSGTLPATGSAPPTMTCTTNMNGLTLCTNTSITFTAVSAINTITNFLAVIKTSSLGSTIITTNTANFNANGTFSGTIVAGISNSTATLTLPLSQNLKYSVAVTAKDSTGRTVLTSAAFDTFAPALVIEASDYNFGGGSWSETPGNGGVWLYTNVPAATPNVDFYKQAGEGPNPLFYRDLATTRPPYITEANADTVSEQKFTLATSGTVIGSNDFPALSIGYDTSVPTGVSDWQNYTRTFGTSGYPTDSATNGTYNVWLFMSISGGGADATLSSVVPSPPTTTSQTATPLGQFGTASFAENDWNGFEYVPMTDAYGNLLSITIGSGVQTYQLQVGPQGGPNLGFMMLMPATPVLTPGLSYIYPDGTRPFDPTNVFAFTVTPNNGSNILTSGIDLVLNGVDVSAGLTFVAGAGNTWKVTYPIQSNVVYAAVISITNTAGVYSTFPINFDTFNINYYQWEAVDYDFSTNNGNGINGTNGPPPAQGGETFGGWISGLFIDNPVPTADTTSTTVTGPLGTEAANSYFGYPIDFTSSIDPFGAGAIAQQGVDIHVTGNGQGAGQYLYRINDGVGNQTATDYLRPKFTAARTEFNDPNIGLYNVGYIGVGNWFNYTRHYPAGSYYVWGRLAFNVNYSLSFGQVTAGVGTGTQTVMPLGTFAGTNGAGYQSWQWIPLLDTNGNKVVVNLTGQPTTFRATAGTGINMEFFMLVPAPPQFTVTASIVAGPLLNLAFPTVIGHNYTVMYENALTNPPNWTPVGSVIAGTGAIVNVTRPMTGTQGYYKVKVQ